MHARYKSINNLFDMADPCKAQQGLLLTEITQPRNTPPRPLHATLAKTANLANLLPTGTVLGFQALVPCFSNRDSCDIVIPNYLTGSLISLFAIACFVSSFTDSFIGPNGKLYYGIATRKELYVFNGMSFEEIGSTSKGTRDNNLAKYRIRFVDFVHAFVSLIVFLAFAMSDTHVAKCYFESSMSEWDALVVNLPLGVGVLSSFLFMIFPTTRRGIGYADSAA